MTYAVQDLVGAQPIATNSTTQQHQLGTIVKAFDPSYGFGEFIYLKGVASTVVGSVVNYSTVSWTTALQVAGTNLPRAVAVAMSACVDSEYGWYQISGVAVVAKTASSMDANIAVGLSGTAGRIGATSTGNEIQGFLTTGATATALATTTSAIINRPHMMGRTAD